MSGINKVIILGRLGQEVETRTTASGMTVANLSVATSKKDKDGVELTEWHKIVLFGKVAEVAKTYLKKGDTAYFEGELRTSKWEKDGIDRYSTEIVCNTMQMIGGKNQSGNASQQQMQPQGYPPVQPQTQQPQMPQQQGYPQQQMQPQGYPPVQPQAQQQQGYPQQQGGFNAADADRDVPF